MDECYLGSVLPSWAGVLSGASLLVWRSVSSFVGGKVMYQVPHALRVCRIHRAVQSSRLSIPEPSISPKKPRPRPLSSPTPPSPAPANILPVCGGARSGRVTHVDSHLACPLCLAPSLRVMGSGPSRDSAWGRRSCWGRGRSVCGGRLCSSARWRTLGLFPAFGGEEPCCCERVRGSSDLRVAVGGFFGVCAYGRNRWAMGKFPLNV